MRAMQLTSAKNPVLQKIRRAAAAGEPTVDGLIVAEGPHLIAEALRSEWRIDRVFTTPKARDRFASLLGEADAELIEVSERALASTAATESPQELLALLEPRKWSWEELTGVNSLIVVLDGIQDPGNAGTIVRSAEAFGATGVVFLKGCARVANGKLLRATAGSIFRIPFLERIGAEEFVNQAEFARLAVYALTQGGRTPLSEADLRRDCALAVGSEGRGVSSELLAAARTISIPAIKVESLNAAVASSIALFEAQRQRSTP